jgi:hypothetical protein
VRAGFEVEGSGWCGVRKRNGEVFGKEDGAVFGKEDGVGCTEKSLLLKCWSMIARKKCKQM